jgi:hypothetical protein
MDTRNPGPPHRASRRHIPCPATTLFALQSGIGPALNLPAASAHDSRNQAGTDHPHAAHGEPLGTAWVAPASHAALSGAGRIEARPTHDTFDTLHAPQCHGRMK